MESEEIYHLPDWQFAKWCEKTFAINRGVYNTIDEKLYKFGYVNIYDRRKALIAFLRQNVKKTEQKYYKFGPGKLSEALDKFHRQMFAGESNSNHIMQKIE